MLMVTNSHSPWFPVWQQLPHTLAFAPFTPFPPLSPHYTIYNDDINNHSLLCPEHYYFFFVFSSPLTVLFTFA
jgi:hypothetical protein